MVREIKDKNMDIICKDEPGLIENIKKYVNNIKLKGGIKVRQRVYNLLKNVVIYNKMYE